MGRIDTRPRRVGTGDMEEPEYLDELEVRRAKHDRLTRGKPAKPFSSVLRAQMYGDEPEEEEAREPPEPGAIDPHLGLDPRQDASLASSKGHRSAKVIIKG